MAQHSIFNAGSQSQKRHLQTRCKLKQKVRRQDVKRLVDRKKRDIETFEKQCERKKASQHKDEVKSFSQK